MSMLSNLLWQGTLANWSPSSNVTHCLPVKPRRQRPRPAPPVTGFLHAKSSPGRGWAIAQAALPVDVGDLWRSSCPGADRRKVLEEVGELRSSRRSYILPKEQDAFSNRIIPYQIKTLCSMGA